MTTRPSQNPSHLTPQEIGKPQSPELKCLSLRPSKLCGAALWLSSLFYLLPALSPAAPPPELTVLRQQYDKAYAERVTATHEASVSTLDAKFTSALDTAAAQAKSAGDLQTVLAIKKDRTLLTDKQPLPDDDDKTPATLKTLRTIYREQLARLEVQRTALASALLTPYAARLKDLEATLTKADRIDEAAEVLAYREGLNAEAPAPNPAMAAKVPDAPTASETKTPAMKPSEVAAANRQLAEWCLNNRHDIDVEVNRSRTKIQNLQDIPKDKFELTRIEFRINMPAGTAGPFPWAALRASPKLDFIYLDLGELSVDVTMDDLAYLGALKELKTLQFGGKNINWVDFSVKKLPTLQSLKNLTFPKATISGEFEVLKEKFPVLHSIAFAYTDLPSQVFEQLGKLLGLWQLRLDGASARLTPDHISALSKLPQLRSLILYPFDAEIDPSIKMLTRIESVSLLYDCPKATFQAICTMPSLNSLVVGNNKNITDADFAAITSLSKLTELKAYNMPGLTDACVAHIAELKSLSLLNLGDTHVTDSILPALAKMKKLKKLEVKKTEVTEAGIAALKKQRPDMQISQ